MIRRKILPLLLFIFTFALVHDVKSQCEGPYVSGNECNSVFLGLNDLIEFIPIAGGYDIDFETSNGHVFVKPGPGVRIYRDQINFAHAANFPSSAALLGLADSEFVSNPLFMYEVFGHSGPFGGGLTGHLVYKLEDGRTGYIEIANAGTEECTLGLYHFIINETGIAEDTAVNPLTGNCPSLLGAGQPAVPTMGQWGIILLSLLILIIGITSIKATSVNRSFK